MAVRTFLALQRHAVGAYDLDGVEMLAVDYGWAFEAAAQLRELAARVQRGDLLSPPVTLAAVEGQAMVERWAEHAVWP